MKIKKEIKQKLKNGKLKTTKFEEVEPGRIKISSKIINN